jgi:stearoyl-CoA desaturase (delta-9 desaturase)
MSSPQVATLEPLDTGSTATGRAKRGGPTPAPAVIGAQRKGAAEQFVLYVVVVLPVLAVLAAVPVIWGWGLGWTDVILFVAFYSISCLGVTVGFHRHFTHLSFKAKPWLRVLLAIAGCMAIQGPPIQWVADHRRHHAYSDRDGDPHSPWRYGTSVGALLKGLCYAHIGWLFEREQTNQHRFAPDLIRNDAIRRTSNLFPLWAFAGLAMPTLLGGLISWSWAGALTAFFWAGLIRVATLHHVTWSINSICHAVGARPFSARDRSANFWPLAILSFGESWHNLHHADPTSARHGVLRGQLDISARVIWIFERLGWATHVKWPSRERIEAKLAAG